MKTPRYTFEDFNKQFPDEDTCLEWIRNKRWPERIDCPSCHKVNKFHRVRNRKVYECDYCGHQISPTAGTILHKSSTSLRSWFYAIFLMASTRTGISAKQLERELGVTYKTAWRMFTQIRKLMQENGLTFFGIVEVDETYIGGKDKNRHEDKRSGKRGRGAGGKTVAVGLVERSGRAVAIVAPNTKAETIIPMIQRHVPLSTGTIVYTDEYSAYAGLTWLGYAHDFVQHVAKEYVSSGVHVNSVENLWSNIKRGISGAHHSVSPKYLQGYLDSYVFRFNHRNDSVPMFDSLLGLVPSTGFSS